MTLIKEIFNRLKSPVVISGLFAIVIGASRINPMEMTSWPILWDNIVATFMNPAMIIVIAWQVYVYLNNPTNKEGF